MHAIPLNRHFYLLQWALRGCILSLLLMASMSSYAGNDEWTGLGPFMDYSSARSIAFDPQNPNTIYAVGGENSIVWKSVNGGLSWERSGFASSNVPGALEVDPQNSNVIYLASSNEGVNKSIDGGRSWRRMSAGLEAPLWVPNVRDIAIDSRNTNTLYAAGWGAGVFKSSDGGENWVRVSNGVRTRYFQTVAVDPRNSSVVYAGAGYPDEDDPSMLFKSIDGGATWAAANQGLPLGIAVYSLTIDPSNSNTLLLGTTSSGIYRSTNAAASWSRVGDNSGQPNTAYAIAISASNPGTIYSIGNGIWKSNDSGANWIEVNRNVVGDSLAIDSRNPSRLYVVANHQFIPKPSVLLTTDGGSSWSSVTFAKLGESIYSVIVNPSRTGSLYAGSGGTIYTSGNDGVTWSTLNAGPGQVFGGEALAFSAQEPRTLYTLTSRNSQGRRNAVLRSSDGGATWRQATLADTPDLRFITADPANSQIIYAGGYDGQSYPGLYKSTDGGAAWQEISSDIAGEPRRVGFVSALGVDARDSSTIYAGTWRSQNVPAGLFKSVNGGISWSPVPEIADAVRAIAVDQRNSRTLYVVTEVEVPNPDPYSEFPGYERRLRRSTNGGESWSVLPGLPPDVVSLLVDPQHSEVLYGGFYGGVYRSVDGGNQWHPLNNAKLRTAYLYNFALDPQNTGKLYAATGEGVFAYTFSAPRLLSISGDGRGQGAILHANTPLTASPDNPAQAGEILEVYCVGLVDGGTVAPTISVGGRTAEILYYGAAPGVAGVSQINMRVPLGIAPGAAVPVRMTYLEQASNEVAIAVR